ncbi:PATL5 [Linum grandiflorum]
MAQTQKEVVALQQFKQLLIDEKKSCSPDSASNEIYFCGVKLELDAVDDRTDVILLKFLRAKNFEVQDAFEMLSRTILWRKKHRIDQLHLQDEDEDDEYSKAFGRVFFMSGQNMEGHPVWCMVYRSLLDKNLYDEAFSDKAKKIRFLKWKIRFVEKTMRKLDFRANGISSIILVMDLKNFTSLEKTAFRAFESTLRMLLDYYPEFVERKIMINLRLWDLAIMPIMSQFVEECKNGKLTYVGPSKSRDIVLRYVGEERIPTKRDGEFEACDASTEVILKRDTKHNVVAKVIALQQFKQLLIDEKRSCSPDSVSDEIYICGVKLELNAVDDRTDVILLRFLRVKDFNVQNAFKMFSRTIVWRKKHGIDKLHLEDEDEDDEYSKAFGRAFFMSEQNMEGHPVWCMVYRALLDKDLYDEAFSDKTKRQRFLKWKIMFVEKIMRKLDFRANGISSIVLVMDLKNYMRLEEAAFKAFESTIRMLLDYYPEFVERQIMINMRLWDLTVMRIMSPFVAECKNGKIMFAGPSKSREIVLRYVGEEHIPTRYEGLTKRDGEFEACDTPTEVILKRETKHNVVVKSCKLRCKIKSTGGSICYGAKSDEESSTISTSVIIKKKVD